MLKNNFSKSHFSEYRENKLLNDYGFVQLRNDIRKVKNKEGEIIIEPYGNDGKFKWSIRKYFDKLIFIPRSKEFKNRFSDFRNNLLTLVRNFGILNITIRLKTNKFHKNKEIKELWGYKLILLDNIVLLEQLNCEAVFNKNTETELVDYHTVYCGPDGKIFGWDKL